MDTKTASLEKEFWNKLQKTINILIPTKEEPVDIIFSLWYKDYGNGFVEKLKTNLPLVIDISDKQTLLKQAIYTIDVGLDGYENHNDIGYLSDMTALAVEKLYNSVNHSHL